MSKQIGISFCEPAQPLVCSSPSTTKTFVFLCHPHGKAHIKAFKQTVYSRFIKPPVIIDPTLNDRIVPTRKLHNTFISPPCFPPSTHNLSYLFLSLIAYCGQKADKILFLSAFCFPGLKGVSQKVKLNIFVVCLPVRIFTIDNLCLRFVQFKSTGH